MEFGSTLVRLREGRGWSQGKLARKVGVTQQTIAAWETGSEFPAQAQLLSLAKALKVKIGRLIEKDEDLMVQVIDATDTYETAVMAIASVVTLTCALALVAISATSPESVQTIARITEAVLAIGLLVLIFQRCSPRSRRARAFSEALEAADGSQTDFVLKRKAGRNTRNVVLQFVLSSIIAVTLIVLLSVIVPESRLPWVMF